MISNMFHNKFKHSHALIIIIVWSLFQCVVSTSMTIPTFLDKQPVAKADKQIKCTDKDRNALLDFKVGLQDPYNYISDWGTKKEDDDCCTWLGVTCDNQTGRVTELDLSDRRLEGDIGHSLFNLNYLTHLDLSHNSLNGTIPKSIGSLTHLRSLRLSHNSFNGNIPLELGNLLNLESLDLNDLGRCSVKNLSWLSHLSQLTFLDMSGISLAKADHWVNAILSLQNLTNLYLDGCNLSQVMHSYSSSFSSSNINHLSLDNNNLNSSMYSWLYPLIRSNTLESLYLGGNNLEEFPKYLGNLCNLDSLSFMNNSAIVPFSDFLKSLSAGCTSAMLTFIDASGSQFIGSISDDIKHFSSLRTLYLDDNQLNGTISQKLWGLRTLLELGITSNSLGGATFENIGMSNIMFINISSNNFSEKAPDLSKFHASSVLDLSSNNFYGRVMNVSSTLNLLNLSRNKFYGGISFLCQIVDGPLIYLDLSHNLFSGQIPDCLWQLQNLRFLNLAHNNLFGRLPASFEYLNGLDVLDLYNNNFSGELPLSLKNCTSLTFLDLGANRFSGNMPVWIGENMLGLYALNLGSNNLFGPIPLEFCQLVNLQILDLSMNNLNGTIPSCVNNLTSMVQQGLMMLAHDRHNYILAEDPDAFGGRYGDSEIVQWQGIQREFTNNLGFLKSIDLSHNNLTGNIPNTITDLRGLLALNLSRNALHGEIPKKIGKLKDLLTLDLSRNQFSGGVPSSISEIFLLSFLDVSYNNLSGRIPSGTQLQSFENSSYTGNAGLCGPPLSKYCPGDERFEVPSIIGDESDGHIDQLERWFYIGGAIGFAIGFWLVCSTLLISHRGRHTFFHFMDRSENWVYVKVWDLVRVKAQFQCTSFTWNDVVAHVIQVATRRTIHTGVLKLLFAASVYFFWQERNSRLFSNKRRPHDKLFATMLSTIRMKFLTLPFKKMTRMENLRIAWELNSDPIAA